jgi:hypothetical protein
MDASTIKCWELSTAQAGARGREGCCTQSNWVCTSLVILLWLKDFHWGQTGNLVSKKCKQISTQIAIL